MMKWHAPWRAVESAPTLPPAAALSRARALQVPEGAQCFHDLADVVTELVWVVGPDGKLLYGNNRWHSLTRLLEGEPFPGSFINLIHPDDRPQWMGAWQEALRSHCPYEIERRVRFAPDPQYVKQLERAQPVWSSNGDIVEWVLVATTCDDHQHLIEGLRRSLLHKDETLVAVAHEMRSPLAPIASAVRLLERGSGDPVLVADMREVIERQVKQLVRLVDDLLDLGRLEHHQLGVHREWIDLRKVVQAAIETAQPMIAAHAQQLTTAVLADQALVDGDEGRLTQVIVNLLANAAKFTDRSGRIWLSLEKKPPSFLIRVRDTGIGISQQMLPRIFDPYVRAERTSQGRGGGLGLGLALARELTQLHDGTLTAHSEGVGKGSEFVLKLPCVGIS